MHYSKIDYMSVVDGTGIRVTLFVSGCRNHCKGCFNPDTWNFDYGNEFTPIEENEILVGVAPDYIDGLTILGGEPFEEENQKALLPFIRKFKEKFPNKTLWMYTGYALDKDLLVGQRKYIANATDEILKQVDILVDGPFIKEQRNLELKFRGSENQRIMNQAEIQELIRLGK